MTLRKLLSGASASLLGLAVALPVLAATVVTVTPSNTQGWSTADTRTGGTVEIVEDSAAPSGTAALELTTDSTNAAKAQYMHEATGQLDDVTELSYYTKQVSAAFASGAPSYQLALNLNGTAGGFTTMVYEPYNNNQGAVVNGVWQSWDVDQGTMWSSRTVTCTATGSVITAGAGGPPFYTLAQLQTMCPDAEVVAFGVNVGSYNPSWQVRTDLVSFNGTSYDFELFNSPTDKDQCKNGGFANYTDANGNPFTNQGQCVSLLMSEK